MELNASWIGPPIDDAALLKKLPSDLSKLLRSANGFLLSDGAFHVRGACQGPVWHSLRYAWESEGAFHRHYDSVQESDIPFAQSALGDQYLLQDGIVHRLDPECDELTSCDLDLRSFLELVQEDPIDALDLQPLEEFWNQGGSLKPGQLLSVMPPFVLAKEDQEYSYRAIDAWDRLCFLADFCRQIRDLPDGEFISFDIQ